MADTTNIPTGLSVQTQIPLDTIKFIQNESLLSNLGQNNNLAFKYYDGLIIKCIDQNTFYIWREVQRGEENTGIINVDFTYPFNHSAFGMNYSNKKFNFFLYNKEYSIVNIGSGVSIFKDKTISFNNTQFNLKKIKTDNLLITDGTLDILINQKPIISNDLTIRETATNIILESPQSASIQALYVNSDYKPTYKDWQDTTNLGKGIGTLAKPFTNTRVYTSPTAFTDLPNTAIQNALDAYVGTGTPLNPSKIGQTIDVQANSTGGYTTSANLNYNNIRIRNRSYINSTTTGYILNMDGPNFDSLSSVVVITTDENAAWDIQGLGFLNSGNAIQTATYATGKYIIFQGKGIIRETTAYANNTKYILNSNPLGTVSGNNDGNSTMTIFETNIYSQYNGIYKVGGKSIIEFNKGANIQSGDQITTSNVNSRAFVQIGGSVRLFNSTLSTGGTSTKIDSIVFDTSNANSSNISFLSRNSSFQGNCQNCFTKIGTGVCNLDIANATTTFFSSTNLFKSSTLWTVIFKNNNMENTIIDRTQVDLTFGNLISTVNFIGNNIIEALVTRNNRAAAIDLPLYSAYLKTNGTVYPNTSAWIRDIVLPA